MRATCFDYGAGNLHSLGRALEHVGVTMRTDDDAERSLRDTDLWILPGVGAFGPAAERLAPAREAIRDALASGLPCLGICLGMQLLFDSSEESGPDELAAGLGVFSGRVTRLRTPRRPHLGWSDLEDANGERGDMMYFAHSYACRPIEPELVTAWAMHDGDRFAASVRRGRVAGVQFHPEKSSRAGLALLGRLIAELTS